MNLNPEQGVPGGLPPGPVLMATAAAEAARLVAGVPDGMLDAPTPCTEWDLRTLLNHTIVWTAYSAERRAHGESVAEDLTRKDFTADPGFRDTYAEQIGKAVDAWSDPAAWERELTVMGSPMPAAEVGAMLIMEMVLHGWDIAKATGQHYRCDDAVAASVLATVEAQAPLFRQYDGFADEVELPDVVSVFDRALAASGRHPGWQPPGN
ncbi:MAG: TIGR03086 family protein [Streptosporangiaceae bacterium]|nr:TIGR03086 family protein [Streptosporangiaceae bacterium]